MNKCVVFDLDDTLYKEIDFLRSAYRFIAQQLCPEAADQLAEEMWCRYGQGQDVFAWLEALHPEVSKQQLLDWYRYHTPTIALSPDALQLLEHLTQHHAKIGLITDGRSRTQRNKIAALHLTRFLSSPEAVVISEEFGSEKPSEANYRHFEQLYPSHSYVYIADNPRKDFLAPNRLGWLTIGLRDNGRNIHPQTATTPEHQPQAWVDTLSQAVYRLLCRDARLVRLADN